MKLGITIAAKNALPSAFVVFRGFEESIMKAADMGYSGVELALKSAHEIDQDRLEALLKSTGMEVCAISTGQLYADGGLCFTHPNRAERRKAIDAFTDLIQLACRFGGRVNVGRVRGGYGKDRRKTEGLFIETMRELCDLAGAWNVELLIEPVNRYELDFVNSLDEGVAVAHRINRSNCHVMADVFHMNIEDDDICASLRRNAQSVTYVHFADSNRLAPGWGHLDFPQIVETLRGSAYNGWITVEILPKPAPDEAAAFAAKMLLPLLDATHIER